MSMASERTNKCDLHISSKSSLFQTYIEIPYILKLKSKNEYSFLTAKYVSKPFRMKYTSFVEEGKQMMSNICISIFSEYGE